MKKIVVALLLSALLVGSGCRWFVPGAVKREASIIRIDVETAMEEVKALEGDAAKEKALRTFNRIQPHLVNLDDYMQGRKATR